MTDLFTPAMPKELHDDLFELRVALRHAAVDFCDWLPTFLDETWAECHRSHTIEHQGKTLEVAGTPDFNAYDREFAKVKRAANKLREHLWDIWSASPSRGDTA